MATATTSKGDKAYKRKRANNTDDLNKDTINSSSASLNVTPNITNESQNTSNYNTSLNSFSNNSPKIQINKRRRGTRTRNNNSSTASHFASNYLPDSNSNREIQSNAGQEQVLNDEEYAKMLQRQFDESFLHMQEIERKDHEIAAQLERAEMQNIHANKHQTFHFHSMLSNMRDMRMLQNQTQPNLIPTQVPVLPFQSTLLQKNGLELNQGPTFPSQQMSTTPIASNNATNLGITQQQPIKHSRRRPRIVHTNTNIEATTSSAISTTQTSSISSDGLNTNQIRQPTNVFITSQNQLINQPSTTTITNNYNNQQERLIVNNGINNDNSVIYVQDKYSILPTYECTKQINEGETECTICFEEYFIGCKITHLSCVHKFHESCIKKWLKTKNTDKCPICDKYAFAFST